MNKKFFDILGNILLFLLYIIAFTCLLVLIVSCGFSVHFGG